MAEREIILSGYSQAAESAMDRDERLTPTDYMLASNPGNNVVVYRGKTYHTAYTNADSARRQFSKLQAGQITGERLYRRGALYTQKDPKAEGYIRAEPRGMREVGLWKIVVHMNWTDSSGAVHEDEQRSFIVRSSKYDNYFDASSVELESGQAVLDHAEAWADEYEVSNVEILYTETIRIQTTTKGGQYIVDIE